MDRESTTGRTEPVRARTIALGVFLGIVGAVGFLFLVVMLYRAWVFEDPQGTPVLPANQEQGPLGR